MKRRLYLLILLLIINFYPSHAQTGLELANKMIDRVKSLKTLQCTVESKERIFNKYWFEKNNFKISVTPFKAYFKQEFPEKGLEGMLISGENNNKTKINPNAFPWINLNLDPEGELMMKNHHHPVYHAGFSYAVEVLDMLIRKYQGKSNQLVISKGLGTYLGQDVWIIECNNPFYKISTITLSKPESPYALGKRLHINYLSILEENPGLGPFDNLPAGKTLKIPTDFASKMVIFLHRSQFYPVYIKVMDSRGLFEEYKFTNVNINPLFQPEVFSTANPEYHF